MSVTGIIAEFNPLHKGHEYLINEAKKTGPVVCVISGNFVQRGDVAITDKKIRALSALSCGADLVLELPVLWSMSTAQNFALGGVSILKNVGCDSIIFGSESGDIKTLESIAEILISQEFSEKLNGKLSSGITFAKARQLAAEECGAQMGILDKPNNNLAIEYILASIKNGFNFDFKTVARKGAAHDSMCEDEFVSATLLRDRLLAGNLEFCKNYMPENSLRLIKTEDIADINRLENAILSVLRTKDAESFRTLPDITEGIENKLYSAIKNATSLEELYNEIKVKRYTLARIRRLVLSAFLGFDDSWFLKEPPYIRVLGFNKTGEELLRTKLSKSKLPIITKTSDINKLPENVQKVFEIESVATDLFSLSLEKPLHCAVEYKRKIIKV